MQIIFYFKNYLNIYIINGYCQRSLKVLKKFSVLTNITQNLAILHLFFLYLVLIV